MTGLLAGRVVTPDVDSYLTSGGWTAVGSGSLGTLWRAGDEAAYPASEVGVPYEVVHGSVEWRAILDRVGQAEARTPAAVGRMIERQRLDVANVRAANDIVIAGSIPLSSGLVLLQAARTMLRVAAVTAQDPRPQINGGYPAVSQRVAAEARMAHTIEGSYVIPILMPLSEPAPLPERLGDDIPIDGLMPSR